MAPSTNDGSRSASSASPPPQQQQNGEAGSQVPRTEQELAQAFRELARGEQTATALEANLTNLEGKLDELLASFENIASSSPPATNGQSSKQGNEDEKGDPGRQTSNNDQQEDANK